jgi:hypothetical protein
MTFSIALMLNSNDAHSYLMRTKSKSNLPQNETLRWNIDVAGREFGLASPTVRKALNKSGAIPNKDGLYTTRQLIGAIFGAIDLEKLRTQEQITKKYQLDNTIVEASVVNKAALMKVLSAVADAMVSRIRASELSRQAQDDLLLNLSSIPIAIHETARAQTRLPAARSNDDDAEQ